jgi:hypothetical protein
MSHGVSNHYLRKINAKTGESPVLASMGHATTHENAPKLLYDRKSAATALSISIRSLDYLIERGDLPTRRIGKKVLIPARDLQRFAGADHPEALRT